MITVSITRRPPAHAPDNLKDRQLPAAVPPLVAVLRQLADVVRAMTDAQYRMKPCEVVTSNVGAHVRHSLDHVHALLAGVERGEVDYDLRQRGTDLEINREAALLALGRQVRQLFACPWGSEERPLRLSAIVNSSQPPVKITTTVGRELAFVLSHTVHHNALIAVMAKILGVPAPERFGYAPSTIAYLEKDSCVR